MASNTKISDFHIRGMTDVTGTPTAEIATSAVEQWGDGTIRFTRTNGEVVIISDPDALKLLGEALGLTTFGS